MEEMVLRLQKFLDTTVQNAPTSEDKVTYILALIKAKIHVLAMFLASLEIPDENLAQTAQLLYRKSIEYREEKRTRYSLEDVIRELLSLDNA